VSRIVAIIIAVFLGLYAAVHVGAPSIGAPAPLPVLLVFAWVIATLAYLIGVAIRRDGLMPVWLRVVPA
jgi:hypothetical protein